MKRTYGENKEIGVSVTARLSDFLVKRADEYRMKNNIESRSGLIGEALEAYITSQKCPDCGAHNPANGTRCSVCGANIGLLKEAITDSKEMFKKIDNITPIIHQKYNLCLTTIKALKIHDTFLLRRFDLITAKLGDEMIGECREYFLGPPPKQYIPVTDEYVDSEDGRAIIKIGLSFERELLEDLENSNERYLSGTLPPGSTRVQSANNIRRSLYGVLKNYYDISQELDQISEYLTEKGKELDSSKKK